MDSLEQMPKSAKFLKDIFSKRRNLKEFKTVALSQECAAPMTSVLPTKLKDPSSFTIPGSIGGMEFGKALCDLGANINLMLLSLFKRLG